MYSCGFRPEARKQLYKLSKEIQRRIIIKLDYYASSDSPILFAKRLKNMETGSYRFRVGDYRIIFDIRETIIVILRIGHRSEIYR